MHDYLVVIFAVFLSSVALYFYTKWCTNYMFSRAIDMQKQLLAMIEEEYAEPDLDPQVEHAKQTFDI